MAKKNKKDQQKKYFYNVNLIKKGKNFNEIYGEEKSKHIKKLYFENANKILTMGEL